MGANAQVMSKRQDIDFILNEWPFDPHKINVRRVNLPERTVLQLRLDMGLLQLEVESRPDGQRPHDADSYFDYLKAQESELGSDFKLSDTDCNEVDREFVQFYHRRICWLHLHEFDNAVRDADHTLGLMDFCKLHSSDSDWVLSHEQYRPFVIYHRTQAAALAELEKEGEDTAERAIEEVNRGLELIQGIFSEYGAAEQFDDDEIVVHLKEFQESLRNRYQVGQTLEEKLSDAIDSENYELAAKLRDELRLRDDGR
ncbi:MAG: UvrB/UvrC motif-containing protein [Pirellulaceae bacterium]